MRLQGGPGDGQRHSQAVPGLPGKVGHAARHVGVHPGRGLRKGGGKSQGDGVFPAGRVGQAEAQYAATVAHRRQARPRAAVQARARRVQQGGGRGRWVGPGIKGEGGVWDEGGVF